MVNTWIHGWNTYADRAGMDPPDGFLAAHGGGGGRGCGAGSL